MLTPGHFNLRLRTPEGPAGPLFPHRLHHQLQGEAGGNAIKLLFSSSMTLRNNKQDRLFLVNFYITIAVAIGIGIAITITITINTIAASVAATALPLALVLPLPL